MVREPGKQFVALLFGLAVLDLFCPAPEVQNTSGKAWTAQDQQAAMTAQAACAAYKRPCLRCFIKDGSRSYSATCDVKQEYGKVPKEWGCE